MNRLKNRKKGIFASYIYFIVNILANIVLTSFVLKTVGDTNYGIYQAMTSFISYLALLEFGMGTVMSCEVSLCKKENSIEVSKTVSTIWIITLILTFIIMLAAYVFYMKIDAIYSKSFSNSEIALGKHIFIYSIICLISNFIVQTQNGLILSFEYYSFGKILSTIKAILKTLLIILVLRVKTYVIYVVMIDSILNVFVLIVTTIFCAKNIKVKLSIRYFDKVLFYQIIPLSFSMLLQTITNTTNGSMDKFILSILMSPKEVSIYAVTTTIYSMFASVGCIPITMYTPQIAKDYINGIRDKELTKTLIQPCRLNAFISGALICGFILVGKEFVYILYGEQYIESWLYAIVIIIPMFLNTTNSVIVDVVEVMNKRHIYSCLLMASTIINVVLTYFGIKHIGIAGAPLATAISFTIQTIILGIFYKKQIGIDVLYLYHKSYKGIILSLVVSLFISLMIKKLIKNSILVIMICGSIYVIIFVALFMTLGSDENEKKIIKDLLFRRKRII